MEVTDSAPNVCARPTRRSPVTWAHRGATTQTHYPALVTASSSLTQVLTWSGRGRDDVSVRAVRSPGTTLVGWY